MWMLWLGVILVIAKYMEVSVLASVSWWTVLAPLGVAFLWFEVLESALGLDKRRKRKESEDETAKRERIRAQFIVPQRK